MTKWLSGTARRVAITGLVAALAAAAIGGVSIARAGDQGGSDQTLVLKEVQTGQAFVNVGSRRPSPGDEFIGHFRLLNQAGSSVGVGDVVCTVLIGNQFSQCQATVRLSGGTLTFSGLSPQNSNTFSLALTGGTGRYDRANGQVTRISTGPNTARDVLDIDV